MQELASLKKDIKKESAPATGSASSSSKVYLGLQKIVWGHNLKHMSNPARLNNGSQHVGSKTGAKACAIKGHNLNLCQTPLGWTTGHNLNICQTPLGWTTGHNLNICQTLLGWTTGPNMWAPKRGRRHAAIEDHNLCCHRANCMVPRQKTSSKKWEIYHSTAMNGKTLHYHAVLLGAYFGFLHVCLQARLKCDSLAFLPDWRSSGHRRSWPQHALCWKALATHYLCLL